nr:hypothetical protein [Tanacetum cinerariifolium]
MTYPVASLTLDSARSYVMQGAPFTQGTVSSIPIGGNICLKGFLLPILLLVVIIVTVVIVTVILVVVIAAIVGVVIVVTIIGSGGGVVDLTGNEDPIDKDVDSGVSASEVLVSLVGGAIGACSGGIEIEQQGDDVASWWPWNVFWVLVSCYGDVLEVIGRSIGMRCWDTLARIRRIFLDGYGVLVVRTVDDAISDEILDDLLKREFNKQHHLKDDKGKGPMKDDKGKGPLTGSSSNTYQDKLRSSSKDVQVDVGASAGSLTLCNDLKNGGNKALFFDGLTYNKVVNYRLKWKLHNKNMIKKMTDNGM